MSLRILIVEDEPALARLLGYNLGAEGYVVTQCPRGDEAMMAIIDSKPDLVILDWMLPGLSGIELCRQIRARDALKALPILMLTARGEEHERVRGLATGADDYVVKPFSLPEFMARVKALLRRSQPMQSADVLEVGTLRLDRRTRETRRSNRVLSLSPIEFRLIDLFASNPGRVYARQHLLDMVWGQDSILDDRTVDVTIGRLRKALNGPDEPDLIRTLRGEGYCFQRPE